MYTIHVEAIKKATPVDIRGHDSKGYHGETPIDPSHDETTPSQDETPTGLKVRPPPSHGETQIIKEPSVKPSSKQQDDVRERLRVLHTAWCIASGGTCDKNQFKLYIEPLLSKYTNVQLSSAIQGYFKALSDKKFMSVRRFAETVAAYIKKPTFGSAVHGIDSHSDLPIEEQIKYLTN